MFPPPSSPAYIRVHRNSAVLVACALALFWVYTVRSCVNPAPTHANDATVSASRRLPATAAHGTAESPNNASPLLTAAAEGGPAYTQFRDLIMVAGHSILTPDAERDRLTEDKSWFLEWYQKGQAAAFFAHIKLGVTIMARQPNAILLFSGGETRRHAGPFSEAQSYW